MTPTELNRTFTTLLNEKLKDTGFSKKRIRELSRNTKECNQSLRFNFSRDRGMPGNKYSLSITMSFSFEIVDKLTSSFLGIEYEKDFGTGAEPLYTVVPNATSLSYKYCSDDSLDHFAEMVATDFRLYALDFYDRFDTLLKLDNYFSNRNDDSFSVTRAGRCGGYGCCIAAVLCELANWNKLNSFLQETDLITDEQRQRINNHISKQVNLNL